MGWKKGRQEISLKWARNEGDYSDSQEDWQWFPFRLTRIHHFKLQMREATLKISVG